MSYIDEPWYSTRDLLEKFEAEKKEAQQEIWAKKNRLLQLELQKAEIKLKLYKQKMVLESLKQS